MNSTGWKVLSLSLAIVAIVLFTSQAEHPAAELPASPVIETQPTPAGVDEEFEIDIVDSLSLLAQQPEEERHAQLADWAMFGTLAQAGLSAAQIRDATYDIAPVRLPELEDVLSFDYQPGRRVVVRGGDRDGEVWFFVSSDDPAPHATVGRLADRVRMETGDFPAAASVFYYAADLPAGSIRVQPAVAHPREELFGEAFGYVERPVSNAEELEAFLAAVDDVVAVRGRRGQIIVGGRRFEDSPRAGVSLEYVAALYQAHEWLENRGPEAESRLERAFEESPLGEVSTHLEAAGVAWSRLVGDLESRLAQTPIGRAQSEYEQAVHAFNAAVRRANSMPSYSYSTPRASSGARDHLREAWRALAEVERDLGRPQLAAPSLALATSSLDTQRRDLTRLETRLGALVEPAVEHYSRALFNTEALSQHVRGADRVLREMERALGRSPTSRYDADDLGATIDRIQSRLEQISADAATFYLGDLILESVPDAPGFSLDPRFDHRRIASDLRTLLRDPDRLVGTALRELDDASPSEISEDSGLTRLTAALAVAYLGTASGETPRVSDDDRALIESATTALRADTAAERENGIRLVHVAESEVQSAFVSAGIGYVLSRNEVQCARYDGPLYGTEVGMNLFYTDALAKVWAAVDYYRSAPVDAVPGFSAIPRERVPPTFWEEGDRLSSTRIWFAPREDRFSRSGEWLFFSDIATRVFAAGSDPTRVGEEAQTNESSRRSFGWWDRHFSAVADHEQQFHIQNQIMKWSVITGWLSELGGVDGLSDVDVPNDHRFDTWTRETPGLAYTDSFRVLPRSEWLEDEGGVRECMERLASYSFPGSGGSRYISGGVSLARRQLASQLQHVDGSISSSLRRGSLNAATRGDRLELSLARGAVARLHGENAAAITDLTPGEFARVRRGPLEFGSDARSTARVRLNARSGGVDATVSYASHDLGVVSLDTTPNGVRLSATHGIGGSVELAELGMRSGSPSSTARMAEFAPETGALVFEDAAGAQRVVLPDRSPTGRYVLDTRAGADQGLRIETDTLASSQGSPPAQGRLYEIQDTSALIAETPWQRLEVTGVGEGERVARVFTARGPPEAATRTSLRTGVPELGTLEARSVGGQLYIRRPEAREALAAFDEAFRNATPEAVRETLRDAANATVQWPGVERATAALRARGSASEVLDALADASQSGAIDVAFDRLTSAATRDGVLSPGSGGRTLLRETPPGASGAVDLHAAIDSLGRGEVAESLARLERATADAAVARASGHPDATRLLAARTEPSLTVSARGRRVETSLQVGSEARTGEFANPGEIRAEFESGTASIYVDEGVYSHYDFVVQPSRSFAQLDARSHVILERVEDGALAQVAPDRLQVGDRTTRLVGGALRSDVMVSSRARHASYIAHVCDDRDGNGRIDDSERASCLN